MCLLPFLRTAVYRRNNNKKKFIYRASEETQKKCKSDSLEYNWKMATSIHITNQTNEFLTIIFIGSDKKIEENIPPSQFLFMQAQT